MTVKFDKKVRKIPSGSIDDPYWKPKDSRGVNRRSRKFRCKFALLIAFLNDMDDVKCLQFDIVRFTVANLL